MAIPLIAAKVVTVAKSVLEGVVEARRWLDTPDSELNPLERMGKAGVSAYCRGVQNLPLGAYASGLGSGVASGYICDPVWNESGNTPDGGYPKPPYEGGQCAALYDVRYSATISGGLCCASSCQDGNTITVQQSAFNRVRGPVTRIGPRLVSLPLGDRLEIGFSAFEAPTGLPIEILSSEQVCPQIRPSRSGSSITTNYFEVIPVGHDDDCGDPPPEYDPPIIGDPYEWGDPIPTGPGLPPVTVPDPTGRDRPGIDIDFGDGSGISIDFGDDSGSPDEPASPDKPEDGATQEGNPVSPGENGDYDFGEPPEGSEWVGYRWEFELDPVIYGGIIGSGPNWISPRVLGNGALRMVASVGDGESFLSQTKEVKRTSGAQFRAVGGLVVLGCQFSILPTLSPTIIPIAAPLPEEPEEEPAEL